MDAADLPGRKAGSYRKTSFDLAGAAAPACRYGQQPEPDSRRVNAGVGTGHDRVQIVAALMAIDAGLERLRHAVLEKGTDDDR